MRNSTSFIVAVLAACGLAVMSQVYLPMPLLAEVAKRYGVTVPTAGLVLPVFSIAYATGFLVFGPLSDRVGRKAVMVPGLLALAIASVLVVLAPAFETLVGARIVQGFVSAALPPVALAYLPEALPRKAREFGIACMSTAFLLAGLLGHSSILYKEVSLLRSMWWVCVSTACCLDKLQEDRSYLSSRRANLKPGRH